ncbi:MAG: hypothetical protein AAFO70_09240 [Pseudomonadota bacterium]
MELNMRTLNLRGLTLAGSNYEPNNILPDITAFNEAGRIRPAAADPLT